MIPQNAIPRTPSCVRKATSRRKPNETYRTRQQQVTGKAQAYVFVNERGEPFGRMGIARMIERAGETAKLPFPIHVHMVRHSTGHALANRGMDTRRRIADQRPS
jgi:site-specific recombinase XerD